MINDSEQLDSIFAALANKYRRAIICQLSLQPTSISELADVLKLSLPAIHKHIAVLEEGEYVQRKKSGRTYFLGLNRTGLLAAQDWVGQFHAFWGSNHETLDNYVASIEKKKLPTKNQKSIYEKVHVSL